MDNFNKIPSLVQIFMAEFFGVLFLSVPFSKLYEKIHPAVAYHSPPLDKWDYVFIALGALVIFWVLATIFRPAVHATRFVPVFHSGGLTSRTLRWRRIISLARHTLPTSSLICW